MTSCSQPYYYILNYNKAEEQRKLHIDTIFGEKDTIKLATSLNYDNWDNLLVNMEAFDADEIVLESQLDTRNQYHFDVIEVKCKLPLLLNLFYVDPTSTKVTGLEVGDISIFSLEKGAEQELSFKTGKMGGIFVYSFNVLKGNNQKPNIEIVYGNGLTAEINENGVYPQYSVVEYEKILVKNKDNSGNTNTRLIFKFGYVIEYNFENIQNRIYSNQNDKNRTVNLFGYIYDNTNSKLNYTGVDFKVSTAEDNVKFCYSTNLGTYINPSLQNCYRVGKSNPYTISTLNPLVMYRNYYSDDQLNYYVGFRTVELNQNITITPILKKYDTNERNIEGANNKITINDDGKFSTILTAPKNNEPYIFTHIHICSKNEYLTYKFLNAYDGSDLGFNGEVTPNSKYHFKSIDNTKLDTELKLEGNNGVEVFVKHVGVSEIYQPIIKEINITYNNDTRELSWNQPIEDEEFKYTIYIDKKDTLTKLGYTLCSIVDVTKLAYFSEIVTSDNKSLSFIVPELGKNYIEFESLIVAEQVNKGKITILSEVFESKIDKEEEEEEEEEDEEEDEEEEEEDEEEEEEEDDDEHKSSTPNNDGDNDQPSNNSTSLIVLIVILSIVIIAGGIFAFIIYRRYKSQGEISEKNKATSMALINSTKNDKLLESQARESNQIDP